MGQPLSARLSFDLSNHYNQLLPCYGPVGWDISKCNAQVLIYDPEGHAIDLDSVHYEMLAELHGPASAPTELFLRAQGGASVRLLRHATTYSRPRILCPWNRHLLTCL